MLLEADDNWWFSDGVLGEEGLKWDKGLHFIMLMEQDNFNKYPLKFSKADLLAV